MSMIIIDEFGKLMDGRHRLTACEKAGIPFSCVVSRGADPDHHAVIDIGRNRIFAVTLKHLGETQTPLLAASIWLSMRWEQGRILAGSAVAASREEMLEWLNKNPDIRGSVREGANLHSVLGVPGSVASAFAYRARKLAPEDDTAFFESMRKGDNLSEGSPILTFRKWAATTRQAKNRITPQHVYLAMLIKTWNGWLSGRQVHELRWRRGGASPEPFPTMLGAEEVA